MDQEIGSEAPADPAAAAFDALRREVALLNAGLGGLAAERVATPDYSETLGEIAQGVSLAVAKIAKLASSPALSLGPAQMAREITQAGEAARLQDRAALNQARDTLAAVARDLRGWIETARLADRQNLRLAQAAAAGLAVGVVLCATLPALVAQAAPEGWAWPEKRAAGALKRDMASAGERLLTVADPQGWRAMQTARSVFDDNRAVIARCARTADRAQKPSRCVILLKPVRRPE